MMIIGGELIPCDLLYLFNQDSSRDMVLGVCMTTYPVFFLRTLNDALSGAIRGTIYFTEYSTVTNLCFLGMPRGAVTPPFSSTLQVSPEEEDGNDSMPKNTGIETIST